MNRRVAIVGAGLIGRAWAIAFARAGYEPRLYDPQAGMAEKALSLIAATLAEMAEVDLLGGQAAADVARRVSAHDSLAGALEAVVWVQENAPEVLETKTALFIELDRLAPPEAILASSTSAILPSLFTAQATRRERCVVVHPLNPPHLIPAVEVVPAPWTSPETLARAKAIMEEIGQHPIMMTREIEGFLMNRLQGALLEECFRLVDQGIVSVEDVDAGLRHGLALRWSFIGPFETIDLNAPGGVEDYVRRYQKGYARQFESQTTRVDWMGPVMERVKAARRERLPGDDIASRQAWRDRRLMALAAHKRAAARKIGD